MQLKELRKQKNLTQRKCADYLGIPLRTYKNYENDESKRECVKYQYMMERLARYGYIDEEHGILSRKEIERAVKEVLSDYRAEYCYLFGSYAKGTATERSDVDLLISAAVTGLSFYELTERLREELKKRVDVLNVSQLDGNPDLMNEILRDGIKIYG